MVNRRQKQNEDKQYDEQVLHIRRVSKKTTGGNYVSFSALVAIGDGKGKVGIGIGRGLEVPPAIHKGISQAKKKMVYLPIYNDTLPHEIKLKFKSARILLKPAPPGTGLKLGGVVRAILDIAGVNNASGKIIGSRNQITNAYAVIEAIKKLKPRITVGQSSSKEKSNSHKKTETKTKKSGKKIIKETSIKKEDKKPTQKKSKKEKKDKHKLP